MQLDPNNAEIKERQRTPNGDADVAGMPRYRRNVCVAVRKAGRISAALPQKRVSPCYGLAVSARRNPQGAALIPEMKRELLEEIGTGDVTVILISTKLYFTSSRRTRTSIKNTTARSSNGFCRIFRKRRRDYFNHEPLNSTDSSGRRRQRSLTESLI